MRLVACVLALCTITSALSPQDRFSGDWRGYWARAGDTMAVTMHVRREPASGRYTATFDAERLRVSGIPFDTVRIEGCCDVEMTLRGDRTTASFVGTLRADSLLGTLREGSIDGRFAFARSKTAGPLFDEREIAFANDPVNLAGSLILPLSGDSLPAVVFSRAGVSRPRAAAARLVGRIAPR